MLPCFQPAVSCLASKLTIPLCAYSEYFAVNPNPLICAYPRPFHPGFSRGCGYPPAFILSKTRNQLINEFPSNRFAIYTKHRFGPGFCFISKSILAAALIASG